METLPSHQKMRCYPFGPLACSLYGPVEQRVLNHCYRCGASNGEYTRWHGELDFPVTNLNELDLDFFGLFIGACLVVSPSALDRILQWGGHYDLKPCRLVHTHRKKSTIREGMTLVQLRIDQSFLTHAEGLIPFPDCELCGRSGLEINFDHFYEVRNLYPNGLFSINKIEGILVNESCFKELIQSFPASFKPDALRMFS